MKFRVSNRGEGDEPKGDFNRNIKFKIPIGILSKHLNYFIHSPISTRHKIN